MKRTLATRLGFWLGLPLLAMLAAACLTHAAPKANDKPAKASSRPAETAKHAPRLPPHYAAVVTDEQRPKLAEVQAGFAAQIEEKREELRKLAKQQDAALRKLLNPQQRQELDKLRAEAAARRKDKGADPDGEMVDAASDE